MPKFQTAYGQHKRVAIHCPGGRTKQSFKDECDVNQIIKNFTTTGVLQNPMEKEGEYGDFTSTDLHSAMNMVAQADSMFEELPSGLRNKFDNEPTKFLDFVQNPDNREELIKMKLIKKEPPVGTPQPPTKEANPQTTAHRVGENQEDNQQEAPAKQDASQKSTKNK